jgi:hypothetical protein
VTAAPTDLAGLCADLVQLYRALGEAITPPAVLDRSLARDATERWCVLHRHYVPFGPVDIRRHVLGTPPTLAAAVMPTARPDNGARRGVPGSRPPLSGPALDALVAQEGIWKAAVDLANHARAVLGHRTRHRRALEALEALPALVDAVERDAFGPLWRLAMSTLRLHRQRARDVLGLSRNVQWLGECPGWYEVETARLTRVAGQVVEVTDNLCWTLDLAAMTEGGGQREIWRRSRIALLRDEQTFSGRPRVVCFSCWYEPEDAEISDLVVAHIGLGG